MKTFLFVVLTIIFLSVYLFIAFSKHELLKNTMLGFLLGWFIGDLRRIIRDW